MASASPALAQFEGTTREERLGRDGTPQKQANIRNFNQFSEFLTQYSTGGHFETDPTKWPCDSIYECWRRAYTGAPFSHKFLYTSGADMLDSMAIHATQKTEAERLLYFQDLMQIYDDRIRRNDSLNSIETEDRFKSTRSAVMVKRADVYWHTAPKVKGSGYTAEKAYNNFVQAFDAVRKETNAASSEIAPAYLVNYFIACRELYETDSTHTKYLEQFLTDYTTCLESCDKMMAAYQDDDKAQWRNYAGAYNIIQIHYNNSGAGTKNNLERFYGPRIESIKDNQTALKTAIKLMSNNDSLLTSNVYFKACHYAYNKEPDFQNCIGMANEAKLKNKRDSALFYFNQADEVSKNPIEHFNARKMIGQAMASEKAPVAPSKDELEAIRQASKEEYNAIVKEFNDEYDSWRIRQKIAADKMQEAIDYSKQTDVPGQYIAPVYYLMAQCYRKARTRQSLDRAEECLELAMQVYPAFGSNDNRMQVEYNYIDNARAKVEEEERKNAERMRDNAQRARAQAAYDAYMAKQKAEEEFWGKK